MLGDLAKLRTLASRNQRAKHRVRYLIVLGVLRFGIPVKAPSAGMASDGSFVVTWDAKNDGDLKGVFAQRSAGRRLPPMLARVKGRDGLLRMQPPAGR